MNELQKEENWYSIKELAEGFGVHPDTISGNLRSIFGKGLKTYRKMQVNGKARTYLYNETAKNELMRRFAQNQLNKANNSNAGKKAIIEYGEKNNWYSIKELAEGFDVSEQTIRNNIKSIFANGDDNKIDLSQTIRKISGAKEVYYNESVKNELMKKLASNQLNQGKNSNVGRQAVKEVLSQKINENNISTLLQQNQEIIRQNNEILKFLKNCIPENISNFENIRIRKDIQDYIMMYSEKEKISYEQGIKEFVDEFEYRNHINLRIRSKRNGYNSILEYADKNNLLPELLEVARNMR